MTRADLIDEVTRTTDLNKAEAETVVRAVLESICDALNSGDRVELRGFGTFRSNERAARQGRNPKTGEPVSVPAKKVISFKPGKELNALVNLENPDTSESEPRDNTEVLSSS